MTEPIRYCNSHALDNCLKCGNTLMNGGAIARYCRSCSNGYPNPSEQCIECRSNVGTSGTIARYCNSCEGSHPKASENCFACGSMV